MQKNDIVKYIKNQGFKVDSILSRSKNHTTDITKEIIDKVIEQAKKDNKRVIKMSMLGFSPRDIEIMRQSMHKRQEAHAAKMIKKSGPSLQEVANIPLPPSPRVSSNVDDDVDSYMP
jgi:hypothetical protein